MSTVLRVRREGEVAVLTLYRPRKRNALNLALVRALHRALERLENDPALRAVVVEGAGGNFAAGADVAELRRRGTAEALAGINARLFARLEALPVPVVAAVTGYALGGGCELALACDLRVAGESAVFGQPEVGLGIVPGAGALYRLARVVGLGRAKELVYTGRRVDAEEAAAMGLVNRVVPDAEVRAEAMRMAADIARQAPEAVRLAKAVFAAQTPVEPGATLERLAQGILFASKEKERRMARFLSRRHRKPRRG